MPYISNKKKPNQIYKENVGAKEVGGLRNKNQIYMAAKRSKKGSKEVTQNSNFADQVRSIEDYQMASDFVQAVVIRPGRVPYIVLHNDDQMADLRRFCCGGYTIYKTVIGVDKTFNLSDLHVTLTVYKNLSLLSRRSGDHPIFMGPVFLHGNSDQETYKHFFHH